jgi:hypothetical protein|tara:strand:- start:704 stop:823 length:120 start_codon:yes stop_codon:yes gene_type:complete
MVSPMNKVCAYKKRRERREDYVLLVKKKKNIGQRNKTLT